MPVVVVDEPSPELVASDAYKGVIGGLEDVFSLIFDDFDALNRWCRKQRAVPIFNPRPGTKAEPKNLNGT